MLAVLVVTTILGLLLQRTLRASGWEMPPVPWTAAIGLLLVACLVYSAAVPVGRITRGVPGARPVDPLRAARTAVLGKATAYAGAVVLGWYLAQVLLLLPDLDVSPRRSQALRAGDHGAGGARGLRFRPVGRADVPAPTRGPHRRAGRRRPVRVCCDR